MLELAVWPRVQFEIDDGSGHRFHCLEALAEGPGRLHLLDHRVG
jgi:hypothetical protein